jgi:ABC-type Fe3+-hydroxamate transport system substrate-binding protein
MGTKVKSGKILKYKDQLLRLVKLSGAPQRIISLVPSQTELLFELGLENRIIGVTKYCIHPAEAVKKKILVGGTKQLNLDKIQTLAPDLIIANKEENDKKDIDALAKEFPVWVSDVQTVEGAIQMIRGIGEITQTEEKAAQIANEIAQAFRKFQAPATHKTCAYLIWRKPWMSVGGDTYINDMLRSCRLKNVFAEKKRYPEFTLNTLAKLQPELIFLSSEPYPFKEKHIEEIQIKCPNSKIVLVDGEMFSWYGSRAKRAPAYFSELLAGLD